MYNSVIATSNTAIIVNSVVVLFVMEIDEAIFAALNAINDKWTEHTAETEEVSKMKEELERQRAQIASHQEAIDDQRKDIERQRAQIALQLGEIDAHRKDLRMLRETVEAMQEWQSGVVDAASAATPNIETTDWEGEVDLSLPCECVVEDQDIVESKAQAATKSSNAAPQCQLLAHNSKPKYQSDDNAMDADVG